MTPIERLNSICKPEAVRAYDDLMAEANEMFLEAIQFQDEDCLEEAEELYHDALDLHLLIRAVDATIPQAVAEYNNLKAYEKLMIDLVCEKAITEIELYLGGNEE